MLGSAGEHCAKHLFRSITSLIPRSARAFHLSPEFRTIVPHSRVVKVEPTPLPSESVTAPDYRSDFADDPGILIEESLISLPATPDSSFFNILSGSSDTQSTNANAPSKVIFRMRRVGDERLSFIQFDHDPKVLSGIGRDEDDKFRMTMAHLRERVS